MKRSYLYRLARYSKVGAVAVVLFIMVYAIAFYKKMDMALFPYNAMFSLQPPSAWQTDTYAVKLDDQLVRTTHFPYWKKDFLEMSLHNYALYRQAEQHTYMHQYLSKHHWLQKLAGNNLVPAGDQAKQWPGWYLHFAGASAKGPHTISILRYRFDFTEAKPVIRDSTIVLTQQINVR